MRSQLRWRLLITRLLLMTLSLLSSPSSSSGTSLVAGVEGASNATSAPAANNAHEAKCLSWLTGLVHYHSQAVGAEMGSVGCFNGVKLSFPNFTMTRVQEAGGLTVPGAPWMQPPVSQEAKVACATECSLAKSSSSSVQFMLAYGECYCGIPRQYHHTFDSPGCCNSHAGAPESSDSQSDTSSGLDPLTSPPSPATQSNSSAAGGGNLPPTPRPPTPAPVKGPSGCSSNDVYGLVYEISLMCRLEASKCHETRTCEVVDGCCVPEGSVEKDLPFHISLMQWIAVLLMIAVVLQALWWSVRLRMRRRNQLFNGTDDATTLAMLFEARQGRGGRLAGLPAPGRSKEVALAEAKKILCEFALVPVRELDEEAQCGVCLENYDVEAVASSAALEEELTGEIDCGGGRAIKTSCNHMLHRRCMLEYLAHGLKTLSNDINCPLCRAILVVQVQGPPTPGSARGTDAQSVFLRARRRALMRQRRRILARREGVTLPQGDSGDEEDEEEEMRPVTSVIVIGGVSDPRPRVSSESTAGAAASELQQVAPPQRVFASHEIDMTSSDENTTPVRGHERSTLDSRQERGGGGMLLSDRLFMAGSSTEREENEGERTPRQAPLGAVQPALAVLQSTSPPRNTMNSTSGSPVPSPQRDSTARPPRRHVIPPATPPVGTSPARAADAADSGSELDQEEQDRL